MRCQSEGVSAGIMGERRERVRRRWCMVVVKMEERVGDVYNSSWRGRIREPDRLCSSTVVVGRWEWMVRREYARRRRGRPKVQELVRA